MVNETSTSREKIVYLSSDKDSHSDLQSVVGVRVLDFLEVARIATNRQIQIGTRGFYNRRYTTLERLLKKWSEKGKLRSGMYDNVKFYAKPRKVKNPELFDTADVYHWLSNTECLLHFITAREGEPLPEKMFRGYNRIADFGVRYENFTKRDTLLLCEFSTKHDTEYSGKIRGKLAGYDECLPKIEKDFNARAIVAFVLDVKRDRVRKIIEKYSPSLPYYFCDFETLKSIRMGEALISPIWIWQDGKEYPLI